MRSNATAAVFISVIRRVCPHWFGWSYNTTRRRRYCHVCGQEQKRLDGYTIGTGTGTPAVVVPDAWVDIETVLGIRR
jgi:hypothetical protein